MFKVACLQRGSWMTTAALLAVLVATDPRLAHFSFCAIDRASAPACESPADVECSTSLDECGCCGPMSPSHRGERDSRSMFVASGPTREGVVSAFFLPPEPPAALPIATATFLRARRSPVVSTPSPLLLYQHFLM